MPQASISAGDRKNWNGCRIQGRSPWIWAYEAIWLISIVAVIKYVIILKI